MALLAQRLGQPLIIGYIRAGAVLGPHVGPGLIHDEEGIELIAEIGLILLLFLIGLELSLPPLLAAGRVIAVSGLLEVPICSAVAWFDRLYLAVCTGFASTLILVKMLSDKRELATFAGQVTLGILRKSGWFLAAKKRNATPSTSFAAIFRDDMVPVQYAYSSTVTIIRGS